MGTRTDSAAPGASEAQAANGDAARRVSIAISAAAVAIAIAHIASPSLRVDSITASR